MTDVPRLEVTTRGDREIVFTRTFHAPRERVFDAITVPALVRRWLLGPPGWEMTTCEIDAWPGGRFRYEWRRADGARMGMGGVHREVVKPERIVTTEAFDDPWYPGEAVGTVVLAEDGGRTLYTLTMRYESGAARDVVLGFPMADGMAASFDRLAALVTE